MRFQPSKKNSLIVDMVKELFRVNDVVMPRTGVVEIANGMIFFSYATQNTVLILMTVMIYMISKPVAVDIYWCSMGNLDK